MDLVTRGWLAIALVIFALWKPVNAIWGSFLFWSTLYSLPLHSGIDEKFPGDLQDASICGNDRRADHYKFQKETREPATGKPWRILFP